MSAEAGAAPFGPTAPGAERPGTALHGTEPPASALRGAAARSPGDDAPVIVEATDLEVVLPSGDGVGPWSGSIRAGEQVLLLGPSGSGKSTLLHALAGAVPSHRRGRVTGSVRVGGIDPVQAGVLATSSVVGQLGQDPVDGVCLPQVADDIALPLESRCVPPSQIGERVGGALAQAGIPELADRSAATLSGGQLQRAGLAAALVAGPRLLLLDEPTAMLDADGVRAVRDGVGAAAADGVATVLVEHRLDDWAGEQGIAGLPPRTIALERGGRVLADGPTAEVLTAHARALREAGCWLPRELETVEPESAAPDAAEPGTAPGSHGAASEDGARTVLELQGARLGHPGRAVLREVDLAVRAGRVLAVVGRNGAGKSTLLGALSRLDAPLAGSVRGEAAGLVFQRPEAQFVADTVEAELAASRAGPDRVTAMLERLRLEPWRAASPFSLSGGQQRRLSIGAVLLAERPVLLADEPGYGLDRAAGSTVLALLREAAGSGRAVVMTTHDLHSVHAADEVVVIADGRLHGPMATHELMDDPALLRRSGLVASAPAADPAAAARDEGEAQQASAAGAQPVGPRAPAEPAVPARSAVPSGPRGPLSRRNPTVLLGLLTALSIVCITLTDPLPLLVLYLLLGIGAMLGCRIGPLRLLRAQLPFMVFASGVFMVNVLSRPGHEPWPELPIRVTDEGIVLGTALALRALVIGLGAVALAKATDGRRTMISLQQHARLPARYTYALLAGRRLLEDLPRRWETLTRAHRVRLPLRADGSVSRLRARQLLRCAFSLLVDAVRTAERLALALEARGLGEGPRTVWRPVPLGRADVLLAVAVALAVASVLTLLG